MYKINHILNIMVVIGHNLQASWSLLFCSRMLFKHHAIMLLLPWLTAYNGCVTKSDIEEPVQSCSKSIEPSAPPIEEDFSHSYCPIYPDNARDNNNNNNNIEASSLTHIPLTTKKAAKKAAKKDLAKANKTLKKCFKYERQIQQIKKEEEHQIQQIEEEERKKQCITGCYFSLKKLIRNRAIETQRRARASKAGLLKAALHNADKQLTQISQYIELAKTLGSKKESNRLTKKWTELQGQLDSIWLSTAQYL